MRGRVRFGAGHSVVIEGYPSERFGLELRGWPISIVEPTKKRVRAAILSSGHPVPLAAAVQVSDAAHRGGRRDLQLPLAVALIAIARGLWIDDDRSLVGALTPDGCVRPVYRSDMAASLVDAQVAAAIVRVQSLREAWRVVESCFGVREERRLRPDASGPGAL